MIAVTDYPFVALGDRPGHPAPLRLVRVIADDGDKYSRVEFGARELEVKTGYLRPFGAGTAESACG